MGQLAERVAIITGASSGIGRASARLFAREGAQVVLAARGREKLDAVVAEIRAEGGDAVALAGDVRSQDYAEALVALAVSHFGGLDVALNNAGTMGKLGPTEELTHDDVTFALETNLTSAFLAVRAQIPALRARGRGSLIFTSTFVGYTVGIPGAAAYAASKAGLIGLTQALAVELGTAGIRVNALLPGGTDTPMARAMNPSEQALDGVRNLHALKRIAHPDEIARAALYLASDASSFTTGTALLVDGGVSICRS